MAGVPFYLGTGGADEERPSYVLWGITHPVPFLYLLRAYSMQSGMSQRCSGFSAWEW